MKQNPIFVRARATRWLHGTERDTLHNIDPTLVELTRCNFLADTIDKGIQMYR